MGPSTLSKRISDDGMEKMMRMNNRKNVTMVISSKKSLYHPVGYGLENAGIR